MSSISFDTAIKYAVEVCLRHPLKYYLLCEFPATYCKIAAWYDQHLHRKEFIDGVTRLAGDLLWKIACGNTDLPMEWKVKILGFVVPVGRKMLTWSEFHHRRYDIPRETLSRILKTDVFTDHGIIDNKKAVKELLKQCLNPHQRYRLLCLYCPDERILPVHEEVKEMMPPFLDPGPMEYWYYYYNGVLGSISDESVNRYRLGMSVYGGSKEAVEDTVSEETPWYDLIKAALDAMKHYQRYEKLDWIPFRPFGGRSRRLRPDPWVPSYYFLDIVCFLLSKMDGNQKRKFLKDDYEGVAYKGVSDVYPKRSRVMECFLKFPYQSHFLETANLVGRFMEGDNYAVLLLKICDKFEPGDEQDIEYGEETSYDYVGLFRDFWKKIPVSCRTYLVSNPRIIYVRHGTTHVLKAGEALLARLLTLQNFGMAEGNIVKLISKQATPFQRETITSDEVIKVCWNLLKTERWDVLNQFSQNWFPKPEERNSFTKKLIFTERGQRDFMDFLKSSNWDAAREFTGWGALNEGEVNEFKEDAIRSVAGQGILMDLVLNDSTEVADEILRRYLPSGKIIEYKNKLAFSETGVRGCANLLVKENTELAETWFTWCLLSPTKIQRLKHILLNRVTSFVREILKSDDSDSNSRFGRGKWERANNFLDWCLVSEEEVEVFKRSKIHTELGASILCDLIISNRCEEGETFLSWLGLNDDEKPKFRKETLFIYAEEIMSRALVWKEAGEKYDYKRVQFQELFNFCLRTGSQAEFFISELNSRYPRGENEYVWDEYFVDARLCFHPNCLLPSE